MWLNVVVRSDTYEPDVCHFQLDWESICAKVLLRLGFPIPTFGNDAMVYFYPMSAERSLFLEMTRCP